jgi:hypothetical protein
MAKDLGGRQHQLRQLIAQQAARMMAEEGISDYAYAKRKAGRQLGALDANCLPTNAEVEEEIKLYHEIYRSEEHPENIRQLRTDALTTMQMLKDFNPHLTGAVLDGTAGRYAVTDIHLFVDSLKDVELHLLNLHVPYQVEDRDSRLGSGRKKIPIIYLEGPHGQFKLSVFETNDLRVATKHAAHNGLQSKITIQDFVAMLDQESHRNA